MHTEMWWNTSLLPIRVASYIALPTSTLGLPPPLTPLPRPHPSHPTSIPPPPPLVHPSTSSWRLGVTWMAINDRVGPDR
jgi:hypothetical protein